MNTGGNMPTTLRSVTPMEPGPARWSEDARLSLVNGWEWLRLHSKGLLARQASRRLRTVETLSLGEKRFVSIVEVDGEQFLLGGSTSSLVLLAKLEGGTEQQDHPADVTKATFAEVLQQASARAESSAMNLTIGVEGREV